MGPAPRSTVRKRLRWMPASTALHVDEQSHPGPTNEGAPVPKRSGGIRRGESDAATQCDAHIRG